MKTLKKTLIIFFVLIISCNKDDDGATNNPNNDPNPTAFAENFGSEIQRTFLGTVIDKNHNPIEGVAISIGSSTAMTDANGVFIIRDATINERFGYVKAEKAGYLHGSRSVVPTNGTNKVSIMLLEETVAGTTTSGTSETIALSNGASVSLQGEYINEDGSAYSGSVNVIMHHLDPSDEDMQQQMPGMLYAANAQNEERMLQTFGMLAVELRGSGGETLNLAEGSSAEIKVPLDASLLANAPATIPLWHFDETYGYWIEDGEATLVGNAYVGTVTQFSFWNCDIPAEAVNLCVTVTEVNGTPLSNLQIILSSDTFGTTTGFTNQNGEVCGIIPANVLLDFNVYSSNVCGSISLLSQSIGPFSSDEVLEFVLQDTTSLITETVFGNFIDCNGVPVLDGYVVVFYNNQSSNTHVDDGTFEISLLRCGDNNSFSILGTDYVNTQETDFLNYTFTTPNTSVGTLSACDNITEFITYQVDDHPPITYNIGIEAGLGGNNDLEILVPDNGSFQDWFHHAIYGFNGIGSYTQSYVGFVDSNGDGTLLETEFWGVSNVNTFAEIGGFIDINFTGVLQDLNNPGQTQSITGTIHVLRDY